MSTSLSSLSARGSDAVAERLRALERVRRPRWRPDLTTLTGRCASSGALARLRARLARLGVAASAPPLPSKLPKRDPVLALVQRVTQGFELGEYERARALGYHAYLEEQLAGSTLDESELEARLARMPSLAMSPKELVDTYADDIGTPFLELKGALVLRAVYARRQLHERVLEFWRDHFHIDHGKGDAEWALLPEHERTVVLPNALGKFRDLLRAVAFSPAMLFYLDNWLNVRGAPQENYARELLELHTLGLHGGYNEVDVKEVAKCFTGWTLEPDPSSPDFLRARFVPELHTPGPKFVLAQLIPALPASENAGRVLDILAQHPSTARFLARKLCARFLTPQPSDDLVERVAEAYRTSGGDVRAMLRVLLARENLAGVAPALAPKFRRPFHLLTSILRALRADVRDPLYPVLLLYLMGQPPLDKVQPDGYPDTVEAWGRSPLARWTSASFLVAHGVPMIGGDPLPGVRIDRERLLALLGLDHRRDPSGLARRIDERLLGRTLDEHELDALQAELDGGLLLDPELYEALALALSLPGFQWY